MSFILAPSGTTIGSEATVTSKVSEVNRNDTAPESLSTSLRLTEFGASPC